MERLIEARAITLAEKTGVWDVDTARGIVSGKITRDKATPEAKKIFDRIDQLDNRVKAEEASNITKDVATLLVNYGKAKGDQQKQIRQALVAQIDQLLQSRSEFGAPRYRAEFHKESKIRFGPSQEIIWKDQYGNIVGEEQALSGVQPATDAAFRAAVNNGYQHALTLSDKEREKFLKEGEKVDPALSAAIRSKFPAVQPGMVK